MHGVITHHTEAILDAELKSVVWDHHMESYHEAPIVPTVPKM